MPRRRWSRIAAGLAACGLLALLLEQLFFATPLFPRLFTLALGDRVHVGYSAAWSVWPGAMHVRDLVLRGEDDNIQWELRADEVAFRVALRGLFSREFHARHVEARGVGWRLRFKKVRLDVSPETLYGLPEIDGFGAMALKPYGPDELDTDATYRLWTIHLEQVDAREVREIWIDKARLTGTAQITGGLFFRPMRDVQVMAQLEARPLELRVGPDTLVRALAGHAAVTVHPFDPRVGGGLSKIDLDLALAGETGDFAWLQRLLPAGETISALPGALSIRARIEGGVLKPASSLELKLPEVQFARAPLRLASTVRLSLLSAAADPAMASPGATLTAELSGLTLGVDGAEAPPLAVRRLLVALQSQQLDLARPPALGGFRVELDDAQLPDLRLLSPLLAKEPALRIEGGSASLHGALASDAAGALFLAARGARLRVAGRALRSDLDAELRLRAASDLAGALDLSGSHFSLERATLEGTPAADWWGRFELPRGQLDPAARALSLDLRGRCLDARPLRLLLAAEGVPGFVGGLFNMHELGLSASLRVAPGAVELSGLDAHGDGASIRANYAVSRGETKGEALFQLGLAKAALDLDGGKTRFVLIDATSWYDARVKAALAFRR